MKTLKGFTFILYALLAFVVFTLPVTGYSMNLYPVLDGQQSRAVADQTLTGISTGAGTASSNTATTYSSGFYTGAATIANNFSEERKVAMTFDLSYLPAEANITAMQLRLVPTAKTVTLGTPGVVVVPFNPLNKLAYATADYTAYNTSYLLSGIKPSGEITAAYEFFIPLNNAGISYVQDARATRYVSIGVITDWDTTLVPTGLLWDFLGVQFIPTILPMPLT